jgi:carboxylesterase type B
MKIAQGASVSELEPPVFNISQIPPINGEETEDCLFLDVVVPRKIFDSRSSSKGAPVLVWIDGGGYSAGYKHEQPPAGLITRSLSVDGEGVVYVAMNYRVGLFVSA